MGLYINNTILFTLKKINYRNPVEQSDRGFECINSPLGRGVFQAAWAGEELLGCIPKAQAPEVPPGDTHTPTPPACL